MFNLQDFKQILHAVIFVLGKSGSHVEPRETSRFLGNVGAVGGPYGSSRRNKRFQGRTQSFIKTLSEIWIYKKIFKKIYKMCETDTLSFCRSWASRKPPRRTKSLRDGELCPGIIILTRLKDRRRKDARHRRNSWRSSRRTRFCRRPRLAGNVEIAVPMNKPCMILIRRLVKNKWINERNLQYRSEIQ